MNQGRVNGVLKEALAIYVMTNISRNQSKQTHH
jgi:hypothetical protein